MDSSQYFILILLTGLTQCLYNINDERAYKVIWEDSDSDINLIAAVDSVTMSTALGEQFDCSVPVHEEPKANREYHANASESAPILLQKLFKAYPCSTRIESYWSYEICHMKHIRQFHERLLPDKNSVLQEYALGFFPKDGRLDSDSISKPPEILLGETSFPYFKSEYFNGTSCDLTHNHRQSTVLYICLEGEEGRILQVSETESCQYQVIFATRFLCENPTYTIPKRVTVPVSCKPHPGSSLKPTSLLEFENDQKQLRPTARPDLAALFGSADFKNLKIETERKNNLIIYRIRSMEPDNQVEEPQSEVVEQISMPSNGNPVTESPHAADDRQKPVAVDHQAVSRAASAEQFKSFLRGHFCLSGQTAGWWVHEICFNKNVSQYHVNEAGVRVQSVLLGEWDREAHQQWFEQRASIAKPQVNHRGRDLLYSEGDFCEPLNDNRQTVVKLRCDNSAGGIYLSFSERSLCRYSVLIETASLCDFSVDELDGFLS